MPNDITAYFERLHHAQGNPGAMALVALDFLLEVQPNNDELISAVNAAAVVHWFDLPTLAILLDEKDRTKVESLWEKIGKLPMVESYHSSESEKRNVHEATRLALRRRLHSTVPAQLRILSSRAITALEGFAEPEIVAERLYHQFTANPEVAAKECEWLSREWLNGGKPKIIEFLRGVLEELESSGMVSGFARAELLLAIGWMYARRGEMTAYKLQMETVFNLIDADDKPSTFGRALCLLGDLQVADGKILAAIDSFDKAAIYLSKVLAEEPNSTARLFDFGVTQSRIAETLSSQGRLQDGLKASIASIEIAQRLVELDANDPRWQFNLSSDNINFGDALLAQGYLSQAFDAYNISLEITLALCRRDSNNPTWRQHLSIIYSKLGNAFRARGDFANAMGAFQTSLDISQDCAQADLSNLNWQQNLSAAYSKLGDILALGGDYENAQTAFQNSLDISKRITETAPANVRWQMNLSASYCKMGDIFMERKQYDNAFSYYKTAMDTARKLATTDADNANCQADVGSLACKHGNVFLSLKQLDNALGALEEAISIFEKLVYRDPANVRWSHILAVAYARCSIVRRERMQYGTAVSLAAKSLKIRRVLAAIDITNGHTQQQLAIDLINFAGLEARRNKSKRASEYASEAESIFSKLVQAHPDHMGWLKNLNQTADFHKRLRNR